MAENAPIHILSWGEAVTTAQTAVERAQELFAALQDDLNAASLGQRGYLLEARILHLRESADILDNATYHAVQLIASMPKTLTPQYLASHLQVNRFWTIC